MNRTISTRQLGCQSQNNNEIDIQQKIKQINDINQKINDQKNRCESKEKTAIECKCDYGFDVYSSKSEKVGFLYSCRICKKITRPPDLSKVEILRLN